MRFGDPECQVLMLRLKSDLLPALLATADGVLKTFDLRWHDDAALTVVMAAKGYPGDYAKGSEIRGLDAARAVEGVEVFHAGTVQDGPRLLANGGRVLNVAARGKTIAEAQRARLCRPSPRSTGPAASAAPTSAGGRCSGRRRSHERSARPVPRLRRAAHQDGRRCGDLPAHRRLRPAAPPAARLPADPRDVAQDRPGAGPARTLVIADLRGYGASSAPPGDAEHTDLLQARHGRRTAWPSCARSGTQRFMVAGHDRGGRVAYRLALDHPEAVAALIPVDIIPTGEVWRRANAEWALRAYHWPFLAQPHPLPETLIGKDSGLLSRAHARRAGPGRATSRRSRRRRWQHYRALLQDPARVHAVCEDYRAGATIDRALDDADIAAGRKIGCPDAGAVRQLLPRRQPARHLARLVHRRQRGAAVDLRPLPRRGEPASDTLAALDLRSSTRTRERSIDDASRSLASPSARTLPLAGRVAGRGEGEPSPRRAGWGSAHARPPVLPLALDPSPQGGGERRGEVGAS